MPQGVSSLDLILTFDTNYFTVPDFQKIYRKYKILNRKTVGDYFFKEIDDLVNKLCDDFEHTVRHSRE